MLKNNTELNESPIDKCQMCDNSIKTSKDKQYPKYCGHHQRDAWVNDMISQGKKVCSRNDRGCRNTMPFDFKNAKCDECRTKEYEADKNRASKPKTVDVAKVVAKDIDAIPVIKKTQNVKSRNACAGYEKDEARSKCKLSVSLKPNAKFCFRHERLEMFTPEELKDISEKGGIIKQCSYKACSNYHKMDGATCDVCLAKGERREIKKKLINT